MNISHEKANEKVQQLNIEIKKEDYFTDVENALKKHRKTAQVPGFRVGNAPMGIIKRTYEKPLISDEVNKKVSETLYKFFEDNKLEVMFEPMLIEEQSTVDFENQEDFFFAFEFAVQPEFELDFATLPLLKTFNIKATATEIEEYVSQIRRRHGDYINPEIIEDDDYVNVKWGEDKDGFFFIKDLTETSKAAFINKKNDDVVTINLNDLFVSKENLKKFLKKSDDNFEVATTSADFTITSIGRVNLAEMNEEFFKKAFPDGSVISVEQLEKIGAQQIELQWKQETDRQFMNDAVSLLIKNISVELPEDFIKRYILRNNKEITEEQLTNEWAKYIDSFKWQLIETNLGKTEKVEVNIEEIKNHIRGFYYQNYFQQFNLADVEGRLNELVEEAVKDKKQMKQLYDQLFDQKIMDVLRNKMNLEEIEGDFQKFISFVTGVEKPITTEEVEKPKKTRRSTKKV